MAISVFWGILNGSSERITCPEKRAGPRDQKGLLKPKENGIHRISSRVVDGVCNHWQERAPQPHWRFAMDHDRRWNARYPMTLEVAVYYAGIGMVHCTTRDISFDGAYLDTGRISLVPDTRVEMVFATDMLKDHSPYRVNANVARVDGEGAAVSFNNIEVDAYRFLQQVMELNSPPGPPRYGQAEY